MKKTAAIAGAIIISLGMLVFIFSLPNKKAIEETKIPYYHVRTVPASTVSQPINAMLSSRHKTTAVAKKGSTFSNAERKRTVNVLSIVFRNNTKTPLHNIRAKFSLSGTKVAIGAYRFGKPDHSLTKYPDGDIVMESWIGELGSGQTGIAELYIYSYEKGSVNAYAEISTKENFTAKTNSVNIAFENEK